jgi:hypothetical protein
MFTTQLSAFEEELTELKENGPALRVPEGIDECSAWSAGAEAGWEAALAQVGRLLAKAAANEGKREVVCVLQEEVGNTGRSRISGVFSSTTKAFAAGRAIQGRTAVVPMYLDGMDEEPDAPYPGFESPELAPQDEAVILATNGGWIGEASMLRDEDGTPRWRWADGQPLGVFHPLGFQRMPPHPDPSLDNEAVPSSIAPKRT